MKADDPLPPAAQPAGESGPRRIRGRRAPVHLVCLGVVGAMAMVPVVGWVLTCTPLGAGYEVSLSKHSADGHRAWTTVRYYGLSSDQVALFVDDERACGWLSDEGVLHDLQWLAPSQLQVRVRRRPNHSWWYVECIRDVSIVWIFEE